MIGLAKALSPSIERAIEAAGAPPATIGIVIALPVQLPETWAAVRAARAGRLQTSLNLALGSALASIGLTIPAVALASTLLGMPLQLGLSPKDLVLLVLTFAVGAISLGTGRTNALLGAVHRVIFASCSSRWCPEGRCDAARQPPSSRRSPWRRPENIVHQTMSRRSTRAPRASSKIAHMSSASRLGPTLAAAAILGTLAALLAGCAGVAPEPGPPPAAAQAVAPPPAAIGDAADAPVPPSIARARARWVGASWAELPGWSAEHAGGFWPAFMRSCERPAPGWAATCAAARLSGFGPAPGDAAVRAWLEQRLRPYRVQSLEGEASGLATGYFEPLVEASRVPTPSFRYPLHAAPPDLASKKPYWTRRQLDSLPAAQKSVRGHELAWLRDRLDVLLLQIQGSGRLAFPAAAGATGGPAQVVRVAYAAHNDQPYQSVGRWLIEQGELRPGEASWPAIRAWARANPKRLDELLWSNPRVVFFREEALPDASVGPKGAQGVPLTPGRSIAVDPQSVPYGSPVWLDTTEPLSTAPLRRLAVAQDTGTAITGAVRADYFWGWGAEAEAQAGRMKQPLRMWVLWPR